MTEAVRKGALAKALVTAQKNMPRLHKDSTADTGKFKYSYLSLESLLGSVLPVLNDNGLALTQSPSLIDGRATLCTALIHESGESMQSDMPLAVAEDAGAQAQGSAITYARRYALLALLGLAPDEDDDGAAAQQAPRQANHKPPATARALDPAQAQRINELLESLEKALPSTLREEDWVTTASTWMKEQFDVEGSKDLNVAQGNRLIEELEAWLLAESAKAPV